MPDAGGKKQVAILGGGMGALAAAFWLTDAPGWRDRYRVTLYQVGWRLGGKGATGRNRERNDRLEEHGIHYFAGWYENACAMMRRCYQELGRSFDDALAPATLFAYPEVVDGVWKLWTVVPTPLDGYPGDGVRYTFWDTLCILARKLVRNFLESYARAHELTRAEGAAARGALSALGHHVLRPSLTLLSGLAHLVLKLASLLDELGGSHRLVARRSVVRLVETLLAPILAPASRLIREQAARSDEVRRAWVLLQVGHAALKGYLVDDLARRGIDSIDGQDFMDWLRKHAADPSAISMERCAPLRGWYDGLAAYVDGDRSRPALAAGSSLRMLVLTVAANKGAAIFKLKAGTGDTLFAPLYLALKQRGVEFKFFHRVKRLGLSPDRRSVGSVLLGRQATPRGGEYDPLRLVNGTAVWPDRPLYERLEEGAALAAGGIDLESPWSYRGWADVEEVRLEKGRDYDALVLGISLAGLKPLGPAEPICEELVQASPAWARMLETIQVAPTLAAQLYLRPGAAEMGWTHGPDQSLLGAGFDQPLGSWDDMTVVARTESWPPGQAPGTILRLCGALDTSLLPPPDHPDYRAQATAHARKAAIEYLGRYFGHLFPAGVRKGDPLALDWELLLDPAGGKGVDRFDAQYWFAAVDPSARGVLAVPGTTRYRLEVDRTGFDDLYVVGDWMKNGFQNKTFEGCVMSGMIASRAISGHPREVYHWFEKSGPR